ERRQDCNERPDPEAVNFIRKMEGISRGRALINVAMGECANEAMWQWGNVSMRRCGDVAMGQCVDVAMGQCVDEAMG
ncbi:hypothetical protein, partial [Flavobacterium sp.]|uniref:hypothetical protein n=1 Tax=Flavobacterium sp. TaxID=239 RepID=UPI00333F6C82